MNESKKFRRLALWVKIRRWGITVVIAVLVVLAAMPVAYKLTQMRAAKVSNEIMRTMEMNNELMAPNIEVSDQYLGNTSVMGGGRSSVTATKTLRDIVFLGHRSFRITLG